MIETMDGRASRFRPRQPFVRRAASGFTLVEVLIAAALGAVVLAGVMTSYLFMLRSGLAINEYAEMNQYSRRSLQQFGIDARMASAVVSSTNSSGAVTSVTLTVPSNYVSTSNKVTYAYDSVNGLLYLVPGDGTSLSGQLVLARNVTQATFDRMDSSGTATTSDSSTKLLRCNLTMQESAIGTKPVTDQVSGTYLMRNVGLSGASVSSSSSSSSSSSGSSSSSSSSGDGESDDSGESHGHGSDH